MAPVCLCRCCLELSWGDAGSKLSCAATLNQGLTLDIYIYYGLDENGIDLLTSPVEGEVVRCL